MIQWHERELGLHSSVVAEHPLHNGGNAADLRLRVHAGQQMFDLAKHAHEGHMLGRYRLGDIHKPYGTTSGALHKVGNHLPPPAARSVKPTWRALRRRG